jgi:hypothetical protein
MILIKKNIESENATNQTARTYLARAARADNADKLSLSDGERDVLKHTLKNFGRPGSRQRHRKSGQGHRRARKAPLGFIVNFAHAGKRKKKKKKKCYFTGFLTTTCVCAICDAWNIDDVSAIEGLRLPEWWSIKPRKV